MKILRSKRRWLFLALAVGALAAVACGDSATATPRPTAIATPIPATAASVAGEVDDLTAEEAEYIEQIRTGWRNFNEKAEDFRAVFAQVYSIKSRLFEALQGAGAGTAFLGTQEAVEGITPPGRFQGDHQIMLQTLADLVATDLGVGVALENEDLAAFAVANTRLTETSLIMLSRLDRRVCGAIEPTDFPFQLCSFFSKSVPGGDYGAQVYDTMTRIFVGAFSQPVRFGPEYEPEDIVATLSVLQPKLTQVYDDSLSEIEGLQPPVEFAADHRLLIKYLEDSLALNRSSSTAVEAQYVETYQALRGEARGLFCDARQQLGAGELRDVVRVVFLDPIGICGGSEY